MKRGRKLIGMLVIVSCLPGAAQSQVQFWPSARDLVGEWTFREQMDSNVTGWPIHCEATGTLRLSWENGGLTAHRRMGRTRCRYPGGSYDSEPFESQFAVQYTPPAISFFLVEGCPYSATVDSNGSAFRGTLECTMGDEGGEPMHVYGQWQATREYSVRQSIRELPDPRTAPNICGTSGRFAVFAFRPLGTAATKIVRRNGGNHQLGHEQLFFCDEGIVVENIGYGTLDDAFNGSGASLIEIPAAFGRYDVVDSTRYDYDIMSHVIGLRRCVPSTYDVLTNNCQHWADEQRRQYQREVSDSPRHIIRRRNTSPRP